MMHAEIRRYHAKHGAIFWPYHILLKPMSYSCPFRSWSTAPMRRVFLCDAIQHRIVKTVPPCVPTNYCQHSNVYYLLAIWNCEPHSILIIPSWLSSTIANSFLQLFDKLRKTSPDSLKKIIPVVGDIVQPNLGITQSDAEMICEDVSVVFHSAATVRFDEPLKQAATLNILGTRSVVELSKKIKNLAVSNVLETETRLGWSRLGLENSSTTVITFLCYFVSNFYQPTYGFRPWFTYRQLTVTAIKRKRGRYCIRHLLTQSNLSNGSSGWMMNWLPRLLPSKYWGRFRHFLLGGLYKSFGVSQFLCGAPTVQ